MSRRNARKRIDNSLTELVAGVKVASMLTGGSILSSYGTINWSNNYSLLTMNRVILSYLFTGNGLFQTAIQLPVQDAMSKGFEIDSSEISNEEIEEIMEWWEENNCSETIQNAATWYRLFGGSGILINTNQDPQEKMNLKALNNSPVEFYDLDRWQFTFGAYGDNRNIENLLSNNLDQEYYNINGLKIHKSRIIKLVGKKAPSYVRRQLMGWGMSEGERMIRDLNLYLKTQDVSYEILDESKVDVYYIENLANKLLTTGSTNSIVNRIRAANEIKNYVNALVLDAKEKFEQKNMTFSGLADIMKENRIGIASALRMPMTKLFGLSASGFNTGESDLENYNQLVESEVRQKIKRPIKQLLDIGFIKLYGYIPQYRITFPSLRVLSEIEEEDVKNSRLNRALALYDRALINSKEVGELLKKEGVITIQTKMEGGILDDHPPAPNGSESVNSVDTVTVKTNKKKTK